jgi:LPXTG-site transpeptidase (sortase) family protein
VTSEQRYIGVARPPQGVDPDPPHVVLNLSGTTASPDPATPLDPASSIVDLYEPETRPWVLARVAAAEIQPVRYGRFSAHRKRVRRAILHRFELVVWGCAVMVVAGLVLVALRVVNPPTYDSDSSGIPGPMATTVTADVPDATCAFGDCATPSYTGPPTRVRIPAIGVDSSLETLGLDAHRELEPPKDFARAGWYSGGVAPGDTGPAIITGHVDSRTGPAVFFELHALRTGDLVEVDRGGQTVTFRVTRTEQYPKNAFPSDRVYAPTPGAELRLITCGGSFDRNRGSYRDNIVVYAIAN